MDKDKLRHLEKQYKLRVKTGCATCRYVRLEEGWKFAAECPILTNSRIRKVKCDETQPACMRCTKTGRTCDG
jgi:hypothetical protein